MSASGALRVAHVLWGRCNPESANGVDKSVYYLSRHQAALDADVAVFSVTDKDPLMIPGVEVHCFDPPRFGRLAFRLPLARKNLTRELLAWEPDVVHIHSMHVGPFIGLGRVLKREGVRYVVTPHGALAPALLESSGLSVQAYLRFVERGYLRSAHFMHAVGQSDLEGARLLGLRGRVEVIPNGIDLADVPKHVDSGIMRREYPELRERVLLFLGRLHIQNKGLDLILQAFSRCDRSGATLVLVGPDVSGSAVQLASLVESLGLGDSVLILGAEYGDRKWSYLAGADVFVHTSRSEAGVPLSVMEALAVAKPVLVTPAADPAGAIAESTAGLVVGPTVEGIAAGLQHLINAEQVELDRMGCAALALASRFSWHDAASQLLEAYCGHA